MNVHKIPMSTKANRDFRNLLGMLKRPEQRVLSVEEMDETILRFHADEMRRINEQANRDDDEFRTESKSD